MVGFCLKSLVMLNLVNSFPHSARVTPWFPPLFAAVLTYAVFEQNPSLGSLSCTLIIIEFSLLLCLQGFLCPRWSRFYFPEMPSSGSGVVSTRGSENGWRDSFGLFSKGVCVSFCSVCSRSPVRPSEPSIFLVGRA